MNQFIKIEYINKFAPILSAVLWEKLIMVKKLMSNNAVINDEINGFIKKNYVVYIIIFETWSYE